MTERLPDSSDICRSCLAFVSIDGIFFCVSMVSYIGGECRRSRVDAEEVLLLFFFFAKIKKMKKCASQKLSRRSEKETRFEYNGYLSLKRDTEQHQRNENEKNVSFLSCIQAVEAKILNVGELPMRNGKDHCDDSIVT